LNISCVKADDLEWRSAEGYATGAQAKVLNVGDSVAPRAILLKIPPGWRMDVHSHIYTEIHYVIEGEYESQGEIYPVGTYCIIPKQVKHGPFSTKKGAVLLVTWCNLNV
jgi:anti-sigma factor ChrR (cupin superfamily)